MPESLPIQNEIVQLPSPGERPDADVVIFDGNCRFCTSQLQRVARWDKRGRLAFVSLHDPEVDRWCPDLTHEQLMRQMYLVDHLGRRYGGAAAFRYLTRLLPRLWILAPLLHVPFSLPCWQWLYRQIARRRYALAGAIADCQEGTCQHHFK